MARRKKQVEHKIRLYPGQDDELIRWMASLDDLPWGEKAQRVKQALLRGIDDDHPREPNAAVNLAKIRQVVEAAVSSSLARFEGQMIGVAVAVEGQADDETRALLGDLGAALIFDDDESE
jgi:hypothetical protein